MGLYRKKPIVIEARQLLDPPHGNGIDLAKWCAGHWCPPVGAVEQCVLIPTTEGEMRADPGDWIIKGVEGEFYPCKPSIFAATYEQADA